jgi:hypothetical protein
MVVPILGFFLVILGFLVAILLAFLVTQDANKRGFTEMQVFLLRVACVIFFPVGLILYLIFRPSVRT